MKSLACSLTALLLAVPGPQARPQDSTEPAATARADDRPAAPFPEGYLGHEALGAALERAARPGVVHVRSLATTAQGRDVWIATLGRPDPDGPPPRPAILIVANLEADHVVGSQVALALVERLAGGDDDRAAAILDRYTVYVVPRLNPDGVAALLGSPRDSIRTNLHPVDSDRDRAVDEDGPDDLDGDGLITTLRVHDRDATLRPDADDPRILRRADATRGERAVYSEYVEGRDDDGDGALNEDPPGGVALNRSWPHRWPEFDREAGASPVDQPETRALVRFCFDHPEIAAVLVYGLHDTLREEPKREGSGLDPADLPYFVALSKLYQESRKVIPDGRDRPFATPAPPAESAPAPEDGDAVASPRSAMKPPGLDGPADGSMAAWAYQQFGAVGLGVRLWHGPDFPKDLHEGVPKPPDDAEARWLYWNDRVLGGRGFVPLRPFDHPTLGRVLVGGWKPGVRLNPPADRIPALADAQLAFLNGLADRLPRLEIPTAEAKPLGGGLFEITAVVENPALLPTSLAQGVRTRVAGPVLVRLEAGAAKLLAGEPLHRIDALAGSGGLREYRWILSAPQGVASVRVVAEAPRAGRASRAIELPRDEEPRS